MKEGAYERRVCCVAGYSQRISLPISEVRRMKLLHGQQIHFWLGDNVICGRLLPPGSEKPPCSKTSHTRNLKVRPDSAWVTIPAALCRMFQIRTGDRILLRFRMHGRFGRMLLIRPSRQQMTVRVSHNPDGTSAIQRERSGAGGSPGALGPPATSGMPYAGARDARGAGDGNPTAGSLPSSLIHIRPNKRDILFIPRGPLQGATDPDANTTVRE